jgi:outer membrane protein assembly complex protein YaeT
MVFLGIPFTLFGPACALPAEQNSAQAGDSAGRQEAEPPVVEAITIEGNRVLSRGDLKLLMHTRVSRWYTIFPGVKPRRFDPAVFRSDVARVVARYKDLGYFDAVVDTVINRYRPGFVRIRIRIEEGEPVLVFSVRLEGLPADLPAGAALDSLHLREALSTKPGRPLTRTGREADLNLIAGRLQDSGYAFAEVAAPVTRQARRADVTFRARAGPKCRFGQVRVEGNRKVSKGLIRRGLTFREGEAYRKRDLLNSRRQLYRSGVFRSVSLSLPDTAAQTSPVDVAVLVRERPPRSLKLGAGYDTEEQVRGLLAWRHRNFLGGGARQLTIESEASALEAHGKIGLRQPYIFGSKTWLDVVGFVEQERPEEIRVKRAGGSVSLERTFRATGRIVFQVRTELVDFKVDSTRTNFLIDYMEDTRDDFFDPQRGLLASLAMKASGVGDFLKLTGEGRWYRKVFRKNVLAFRVSGGMILSLGTAKAIPNFERFFAGGANSVRGWRLNQLSPRDASGNPVGGRSLLEGSIELRTRLLPVLGMAVFLDAGNVGSDRFGAFKPGGLHLAAGAGVRYLSPISPLRIDVAYRLSEDRFVPHRRIYFSLGQAF